MTLKIKKPLTRVEKPDKTLEKNLALSFNKKQAKSNKSDRNAVEREELAKQIANSTPKFNARFIFKPIKKTKDGQEQQKKNSL